MNDASTIVRTRPRVMQLISSLNVGGAESLLVAFAWAASDCETSCVIINDQVSTALLADLSKSPVTVHQLGKRVGEKHPKFFFRLLKIIDEHDIRIIHCHNSGARYWAIACKLARPRIRIVYTLHGMRNGWPTAVRFLHNRFVDTTIAISGTVQQDCAAMGIRSVVRIPNGIAIADYPFRLPHPSVRPIVVCVARLNHAVKGQDVLIAAIKACVERGSDLECWLVGDASGDAPESAEFLRRQVESAGLGDRVRFIHGRTDVARILSEADIFVAPSRQEGFGLAALEAMAIGVPVIASNVGGLAELVEHRKTGLLVEPQSSEQLATGILELIGDSALQTRLARAARTRAERFDIARMIDAYTDCYKALL